MAIRRERGVFFSLTGDTNLTADKPRIAPSDPYQIFSLLL
jgi:hypothetical protein